MLALLSLLLSFVLYERFFTPSDEAQLLPLTPPGEQAAPSSPAADEKGEGSRKKIPIGTPVRFLMFNTQNYFVADDTPRTRYKKRMKTVAERDAVADTIAAAEPEIVGLVEMGGRAALEDMARRLKKRGLVYTFSRVLERWGEDRALAILSRHPIVRDDSIANCLLEGRTGRHMLRGILDVTVMVEKDGRMFRIMGVHLKSRVTDDPRAAERQRNREARTLANHLHRVMSKDSKIPILVFGDWNADPTEAAPTVVAQGIQGSDSMRRVIPTDSRGESWTIAYRADNKYNAFDQIYVNRVLSSRMGRHFSMGIVDIESARRASDHRAIWCDLR